MLIDVCASGVCNFVLIPFGALTIEVTPNDKIRYWSYFGGRYPLGTRQLRHLARRVRRLREDMYIYM